MFLSILKKYRKSIVLRLTFCYTGLLVLVFLVTFFLLYEMISLHLETTKDRWLLEEIDELQNAFKKGLTSQEEIKKKIDEELLLSNNNIFYCVRDVQGNIICSSDLKEWQWILERKNPFFQRQEKKIVWETIRQPAQKFSRICYTNITEEYILQLAISLKEERMFLKNLIRVFIPFFLFPAIVSFILVFFIVKNTLRPVHEITKTAAGISFQNIAQRIPTTGVEDELENLSVTINSMLDRIQSLVVNIKETNDHLAHNLRTPISRIRINAEINLLSQNQTNQEHEVLENCIIECDLMLDMLNTMLDISEVEAGILSVYRKKIDLNDLVYKNFEFFKDLAEYKNISIEYNGMPNTMLNLNTKTMSQAIGNLIDNSVKFTNDGGKIKISLYLDKNYAALKISDTGMGISEKELKYIFDRFYRAENAINTPGSGLGLSFVKAVIEAHGGKIEVESQVGKGSIFTIFLPM